MHLHSRQRSEFIPCLRNSEPTALPFQGNTPTLQGGTCISYSVEAPLLKRLTKSGREGQIIVLFSDLNNKLSRVPGLLTNTSGVSGHSFPARSPSGRSFFPALRSPIKRRGGERHLANSHITADCLLITSFPFQKNNSKQIRHSICLGQLPQTVKCSNKSTRWGSLAR